MKTRFYYLLFFTFLLSVSACEEDTPSGPPPTGENLPTEILAEPGQEIHFTGTFADENGFKSISLKNTELLLDKQINFANPIKQYFLDYKFTVPADAVLKDYAIEIVAENLSGETTPFSVEVDVATPPSSPDMTSQYSLAAGDELSIVATINDDLGIVSIKLLNAGIGLDHTIELTDNPKSYALNYVHAIANDAPETLHNGTIEVTNIAGRTTSFPMAVNLSSQALVYENIYVAGGFQWWTWDAAHAFPMNKDPENDKWFETELHSWAGGYDDLKFLGQLDWNPHNWGLADGADPSKGMLNDENSAAIVLGADGSNPTYFKVRFNPYDMQYETEKLTPDISARTEMYIVGSGFPDYPTLDWNPDAAIPMTPNPDGYGEHIFLISGLKFSDDVSLKFIGQTTGWDYDAGFDVEVQEVEAPVTWVKVKEGSGTKDLKFKNQAGTYTVLYDYYLKRALVWKE